MEPNEAGRGIDVAKVLVAVLLEDEEARALEEIARMEGHGDPGRVLERALRTYLAVSGSQ